MCRWTEATPSTRVGGQGSRHRADAASSWSQGLAPGNYGIKAHLSPAAQLCSVREATPGGRHGPKREWPLQSLSMCARCPQNAGLS